MKKLLFIFAMVVLASCSKDEPASAVATVVMNRVIEEKIVYLEQTATNTLFYPVSTIDWRRVSGTDLLFFSNDIKDDGKIISSFNDVYTTAPMKQTHKFVRYIIRKQ